MHPRSSSFLFFFNDTATTEIYTLSLHDALPISGPGLYPLNPLRFQDPGEGSLHVQRILHGHDVIGHDDDLVSVGDQRGHDALDEGRFPGSDRTADSYARNPFRHRRSPQLMNNRTRARSCTAPMMSMRGAKARISWRPLSMFSCTTRTMRGRSWARMSWASSWSSRTRRMAAPRMLVAKV